MRRIIRLICLSMAIVVPFAFSGTADAGRRPPTLGRAKSFAVLATSTITNTGPTVINGNVGLSPGTAVTGFPPGTINGNTYTGVAPEGANAQIDVTAARNKLAAKPCTKILTGTNLGGLTLTPGVYCFASSALLSGSGTLTLNGKGNPNAVFIFKTGSSLTTASASIVRLIRRARACNVFWQIGSSATLGTDSVFKGNVIADISVTLTTGASLAGRAIARNGAVTMDSNRIARQNCRWVRAARRNCP